VIGMDQSEKVLRKAREHHPEAEYVRISMQELPFRDRFDGIICMDAMEYVGPEDYPVILSRFQQALKPMGVLYFSADREE
jgi:2-polyprenyl-3-methyl-5-hydroxy-6-metoxy-1,4-benzoquinol methylase